MKSREVIEAVTRTKPVSAIVGCRRGAAVLCGALIGWSCANGSGSSIELEPASGGEVVGTSASSGGFGGSTGMAASSGGHFVATLCGDPECPPLPGEDASTDDMEAGHPADGSSEASADGSMADGATEEQDVSPDGPRSDSGGDGGSLDSEVAGD